jgi:hypothetical protein
MRQQDDTAFRLVRGADGRFTPGVTYAGFRSPNGAVVVRVEAAGGGAPSVRSLAHRVVKHSPTGFEWGYAGSGPHDLALNLLIDALDAEDVWCPGCGGQGRRTLPGDGYGHRCMDCWGQGLQAELLGAYGAFADEYVSVFGEQWAVPRQTIREWYDRRRSS